MRKRAGLSFFLQRGALVNLSDEDDVIFAVKFGAFGTGSVKEVEFFNLPIAGTDKTFHILNPAVDVFVRAFKNFGEK